MTYRQLLSTFSLLILNAFNPAWAIGSDPSAADKPIKSRDWIYAEKVVGTENLCVAQTQKKVGQGTWSFSLVVDASRTVPPAFYIVSGAGDVGDRLSLQADGARALFSFLKAPTDDARAEGVAYWFAPDKFSSLALQLRRGSGLKITYLGPDGKTSTVYFSLAGSTSTLETLQKKCAADKKDVVLLPFFDALDRQVPGGPAGSTGVAILKKSLEESWTTYLATGVYAAEIKRIETQMGPALEQEKTLLGRTGKLNGQLDSRNAEKAGYEQKKAALQATRLAFVDKLAVTQKQLADGLVDLKSKEDLYRPAAEQVKPFTEAVQTSRQNVEAYSSRISDAEGAIESATAMIARLQAEQTTDRNQISQLESSLRDLEGRRSQAVSNLNSFNFNWRFSNARDSDSQYRSYQDAIQNNQRTLDRLRGDVRRAEDDYQNAERELRRCETSGPSFSGPERPHPFPRPSLPDCSSQRSRLEQARNQRSSASENLRREQQLLSENIANLERRKREIASVVQAEYAALQNAVVQIESQMTSIQSQIRDLARELADIGSTQIPAQRESLNNASAELRDLRPALASAQEDLVSRQRELAQVSAETGFVEKKQAYESARVVVTELRDIANGLDAKIKSTDERIAVQDRALAKVQAGIDVLLANLARETAGLEGVEAILNPLRAEKAAQVQELVRAQATLVEQMSRYRAAYGETMRVAPGPTIAPANSRFFD